MNKEQQRIAIAEACGWTVINDTLCHITPDKNGEPEIEPIASLPDYLNDLNAMHEAEKMMTKDQWLSYPINVLQAAKDGTFVIDINMKTVAHATAEQRAEAFLRTIGKWKEDSK